ncbi:Hypothetical protein, putative [Bodo saltans]|uniref:Uncharacterized protein n=1 Tax=Bodo saltans TaxID=75058 RepID=A0A0S4J590_BODSA|nr:Hypothetical protein, putative [Bodo saltans]|eukprot:CUG81325.1 Hypothetical protein, putative [Bodo saltans]
MRTCRYSDVTNLCAARCCHLRSIRTTAEADECLNRLHILHLEWDALVIYVRHCENSLLTKCNIVLPFGWQHITK